MNRRHILKTAAALAGVGPISRAKLDYIDGPCCLVTTEGAYLHYSSFRDAMCAAGVRKDITVERICPVSEYWEMIQRLVDEMNRNPDEFFEEFVVPPKPIPFEP